MGSLDAPEELGLMNDYKKTLNLPDTTFPMKASLPQNEPKILEKWRETDAYSAMVHASENGEPYTLHDGPPYANGHIHIGHAMNKILKDIIVKHRNMAGRKARYVPGWDCHGLPIELKVEQELGGKDAFSLLEIRRKCREYALRYLDIQREEFKRLGVFGTWDDPYITMTPAYETATARELANFYATGSVQRNKKPIYWCGSCETALAEAEVEYDDHTSPSIYVRFPLEPKGLSGVFPQADPRRTYIVIWTTRKPFQQWFCRRMVEYVQLEREAGYTFTLSDNPTRCNSSFAFFSASSLVMRPV